MISEIEKLHEILAPIEQPCTHKESSMQFSRKIDVVRYILDTRTELSAWYDLMIVGTLTAESVMTYGTHAHGDIVDQMLEDAGVSYEDGVYAVAT
jgi:hypothetical protein